MKKEFFVLGLIIAMFPITGHGKNLELPWAGYWPNVGDNTPQDVNKPVAAMPQVNQMQVVPSQPALLPPPQSKALVVHTKPQPQRVVQDPEPVNISAPAPKPLAKPAVQQKPAVPTAAPAPAAAPVAQASAGGNTALAGIGAAFAALGSLGSNSQRSEPSRLNPYMGQGRTATEHFNCVGKPPQQCQQEWDQLVRRIEIMPGVRILNKQYGCGPQAIGMMGGQYPGAMQTGYGVHPTMGGYPQQPYGVPPGMGGYPAYGSMGVYPQQPQQHHSTLSNVAHGLTGLFRR